MAFNPRLQLIVCCCSMAFASVSQAGNCESLLRPDRASDYQINVDVSNAVRGISPEYFGFNLEWVQFQYSLWDSSSKKVKPEVIEWLKAFPGAVYRYPGGTLANHFIWRYAIEGKETRKKQMPATWRGLMVAEFGLPEYLDFVQAVGGRAWYVLNLYGTLNNERSPSDMTNEVSELADYLNEQYQSGRPRIYRWELGNELDRDQYRWRPEKYSQIAVEAAGKLRDVQKDAQIVSLAQDWPASKEKHGVEPAAYNQHLGKAFKGKTNEFAAHLYYDGKPWGPPVPNLVRQHCQNSQNIKQGLGSAPAIWVTEHARTPKGTPADSNWKANWPQSADLAAAIGVADITIALSQDPSVKGLFVHALHGTDGPWPLFHLRDDGVVVPSATYWGLRLLRDSLLDEVVTTSVTSANHSAYEGGYDLRAVAQTNQQRNMVSIWLVNRANQTIDIRMNIPKIVSRKVDAELSILAADDAATNNYGGQYRIRPRHLIRVMEFDSHGVTNLIVPANAVVAVRLPLGRGLR